MVSLARKNLFHDRIRFAITLAGVAFAVTLVLVQVGLFLGLLGKATVTIENSSADIWIVAKNTPNVDFGNPFPETAFLRARGVPGVERADNAIVQFVNIQLPSGATENALVYGLSDPAFWNLPWKVEAGRAEDLSRGYNLMMDRSASLRFGAFDVGDYREVGGRRFRIIGRSAEAESFTTTPIVFMDFGNAQSLLDQLRGNTTYVLVKVAPGFDPAEVAARLRPMFPFNNVHTRDEWAAASRGYWIESTGLGMSMGVTVFLGILVGVVIVAQTLYTSAVEHIREFGTVKAIGGSNWDIYKILGEQALIAAVLGFLLGAGASYAVRPAMASLHLTVLLTPQFSGIVFVGTVAMCLAAALFSFRRVALIDPALVFRG
ncbi:MAG: ABC transporter permease [Vicinamibacteria bacterium]|jgi:putative ABC transport system permease protein|nr:ABC transporter permease [Vicinamibacteria bacterium]MBP9944942.1 ABC transporter permease [Vicinamibacteria bacterium]